MAFSKFIGVKISGIACAVPTRVIKNIENENFPKCEIERFIKKVGVEEHRKSIEQQTASDLGYEAAKKIINKKDVDVSSIDGLIFISQNPDYFIPSTAYIIANRLRMTSSCMAFDVNLGCSGFVYGVNIASSLIIASGYNKVLVIIGDVSKRGFNNLKDDLLFGDCGSAILFEKGNGTIFSEIYSDGSRYKALITKGGGARHPKSNEVSAGMIGEDVMNFTITDVPVSINKFLEKIEKPIDEFDYILLHQANIMMLKTIARKINADFNKVPISMDKYGNVNGSSIPLTLVDMIDKHNLPASMKLLTSGFGVGLSWGVNCIELESSAILPLIETDDFYREAF